MAARLAKDIPDSFFADQFNNPANPLAHASSAYHFSGFQEKTAILGIDGKGEYATTFFGYGENGKIHKIKEFYDPDSQIGRASCRERV